MAEHPNVARIRDALAPRAEAVFGNIGMTGSGRSGGTTAPLRRMPFTPWPRRYWRTCWSTGGTGSVTAFPRKLSW
jgi:hypothetical protein